MCFHLAVLSTASDRIFIRRLILLGFHGTVRVESFHYSELFFSDFLSMLAEELSLTVMESVEVSSNEYLIHSSS